MLATWHVPLLAVCNAFYFYVACLPILCFYDHYLFVVGFDGLNSLCLNNDMRAVVCRPSTANPWQVDTQTGDAGSWYNLHNNIHDTHDNI